VTTRTDAAESLPRDLGLGDRVARRHAENVPDPPA
jgi:hypothetical protein